jgi:hypothetical protein
MGPDPFTARWKSEEDPDNDDFDDLDGESYAQELDDTDRLK